MEGRVGIFKSIFTRLGYSRFAFPKAMGFTGGITLGWKADLMQIFIINYHFQYIHSQITMEDGKIWYLTTVYVSPLDDRKKELQMDLTSIATSMDSAHVKVLHHLEFSDHHLVLLTLMDKDLSQVPKEFKFECAWLVEPSFEYLLNSSWNTHQSLLSNLESFKTTVMQWKLHNIGSIRKEKLQLMHHLEGIQKVIQDGRDHEGLRKLEKQIQTYLSKTLFQEELL
ncbi:hypothetical protein KIW84_051430 [Lathyrus oleraceus]|uniref:Uncharacterized protein n=1 Tax=Pisum sativum TaxID=3888 RepID=A0A9D5AAN2_PEA|nr:hypothetical protein KIW84_051430 [Pisum sativum]